MSWYTHRCASNVYAYCASAQVPSVAGPTETLATWRSGIDTGVYCNPLHEQLDPYTGAYAVTTLLDNLFGPSKERFWQQGYTHLLKFVTHR